MAILASSSASTSALDGHYRIYNNRPRHRTQGLLLRTTVLGKFRFLRRKEQFVSSTARRNAFCLLGQQQQQQQSHFNVKDCGTCCTGMWRKVQYNVDGTVLRGPSTSKTSGIQKNLHYQCNWSPASMKEQLHGAAALDDRFVMRLTCAYVHSFPIVMSGRLLGGAPPGSVDQGALKGNECLSSQESSVLNRVVGWLDWAFMVDGQLESSDAGSVSTYGEDCEEEFPAIDLVDKLAAWFISEGFGEDLSEDLFLHKVPRQYSHQSSPRNLVDENRSEPIEQDRIPLNLEAFLYDDTSPRIDYNINQMDITKMEINASKHLNLKSIHELPTIIYNPDNGGSQGAIDESWNILPSASNLMMNESDIGAPVCVICQEDFFRGDRLRILPCGHKFHIGCIDHWLLGTNTEEDCVTSGCPTCKKTVTEHQVEDEVMVQEDNHFPSWAFFRLGTILSKGGSGTSSESSNDL